MSGTRFRATPSVFLEFSEESCLIAVACFRRKPVSQLGGANSPASSRSRRASGSRLHLGGHRSALGICLVLQKGLRRA